MGSQSIIKSPLDTKDYKMLKLANGLDVLLISKPDTKISSATMCVSAGSNQDTNTFGTAHLVEHMICKYLHNGESYRSMSLKYGGHSNASTSGKTTTYYFTVNNDKILDILEVFAQPFIHRTIDESLLLKEMNAVDSEFYSKKTEDSRRLSVLLRLGFTRSDSCLHKFTCGSLETLNTPDIFKTTTDFIDKYYYANNMKLCIMSSLDINTLESSITKWFSLIPFKDCVFNDIDTTTKHLITNKYVKIVSIKKHHKLNFFWEVPLTPIMKKYKISNLLSHVIGDETRNTLIDMLKRDNIIKSMYVSGDEYLNDMCIFKITVSVTEENTKYLDKITNGVYQYLELIKANSFHDIYNDIRTIEKCDFINNINDSETHLATRMAHRMVKYDTEQILTCTMYPEYKNEIVDNECQRFLNYLIPTNSVVVYEAQNHDNFIDDVQTEHFYGIKYKAYDLKPSCDYFDFVFDTVRKNPYINGLIRPLDTAEEKPHQIIHENHLIKVWWKYDSLNKQQISLVKLKIFIPNLTILEHSVKAQIYVDVLNWCLNPYIYEAHNASCSVDVTLTNDGLVLQVNGYTQYVEFIMYDMLHRITTFNFANVLKQQFESLKTKNIDNLINNKFQQSSHQAFCHNRHHLFSDFTNDQKLEYLKSLTYDDMLSFNIGYKNIILIMYGTLGRHEAENLWRGLTTQLMRLSHHNTEVINNKINPSTQLINNNTNDQDINSATLMAYYLIHDNLDLDYLRVCRKVLLKYMGYQFTFQVRTQDKFGYAVHSGENTQEYGDDEYESIYFLIVSNHKTNDEMKHRIYQFIRDFEKFLNNIDENDVEELVKSLADKLKIKNDLFYNRCSEFISIVDSKKPVDFGRKDKLIKLYENMDKKQLIQFYHDYVLHNHNEYISHVATVKKEESS